MIVTPLGVLFVALFAVCLLGGRSSFIWAVAISLFFQDSAMCIIGGIGLAPYSVALTIALVLQIVFVVRVKVLRRGVDVPVGPLAAGSGAGVWLRRALLVLVVYGVLVSAVGPLVFEGVQVMPSQGSSDYLVDRLPRLAYSLSNAAQIVYLLLNGVLVWFISTLPRLPRTPFSIALLLTTAIVLVAIVLTAVGIPWPLSFFDNSPRNYYADFANDPRLRAHFSEPSHLAWFLALALAYGIRLVPSARGLRRVLAIAAVGVCCIAFLQNPSTTIILTAAVMVPVVLFLVIRRYRSRLRRPPVLAAVVSGLLVVGVLVALLWAPLSEMLGPALLGKVGSSSQYSRGKQDLNALSLFAQSWGLGVGLGSNRSSSLLTMLLSDVGLIGTVAYYAVIVLSIVVLLRRRHAPEGWALMTLAVACAISVADFVSPPTWFLIGLAAHLSRPLARYGGVHRASSPSARVALPAGASR